MATKKTRAKKTREPSRPKRRQRRTHEPCAHIDYDRPGHQYDHQHPPDNPRYPDVRIYGDYASKRPPAYVPHPYDHACFRPREEDYKPPVKCEHDEPASACGGITAP